MNRLVDRLLDRVLEKVETRMVEVLAGALEARLMAMLEGEGTPTPKAKAGAHAGKASRKAAPKAKVPKVPKAEPPEAFEAPAPEAKVVVQPMSLEEALRVASATLEKYRGVRTKGGKDYADVLTRRINAVVRHAEKVGADPYRAVWDSLKLIQTDPVRYVQSGYTLLAETLGLPPAPKE